MKTPFIKTGAVAVFIFSVSPCCFAEYEVSMGIVSTGTRKPVPYLETTREVRVIDRDYIEESGIDSLPELLSRAAGLDIQSRSPFGVQSDLSIRGSTFQQVLVLVDGIRMNDSQTAHHNMDIPVNLSDIERIEVMPGHGSSLYGPDAFGGVINIITKKPSRKETKGGVTVGQYGLLEGSFSIDRSRDKYAQSISVERRVSSGFRDDTDFDLRSLCSISHLSLDKTEFKLSLGALNKEFGAYDFYTPGLNYPSREWTRTDFANLEMSSKLKKVSLKSAVHFRQHYDKFVLDNRASPSFCNEHLTCQYGGEVQLEYKDVVAGGEITNDRIDSTMFDKREMPRQAIFVELNRKFSSYNLGAGVRADHSVWGWSVNPNIGFSRGFEKSLLRVSAGRAFRTPSFTELYYDTAQNKGDSALKPENAVCCEAGVSFFPDKTMNASFTVFNRLERDLIDWVGASSTGPWKARNIGKGDIFGLECGIEKRWKKFSASLKCFLNGSIREQDYISKYALRYPEQQAMISFVPAIFKGIAPVFAASYKRRFNADINEKMNKKGYLILDFSITRAIEGAELFIKCTNLLDSPYEELVGVPQPGRWLSAGIKLKLS